MTNRVSLRPAQVADADACAAIVDAWIDATDWMPRCHDADDIARHYREDVFPAQAVTVAEIGCVLGGFIAVDPKNCVTSLYLAPGFRNRGIGAHLLRAAKSHASDLSLWTFQANDGARRFYAREGFREAARSAGDNAEGLPDVEYIWTAA